MCVYYWWCTKHAQLIMGPWPIYKKHFLQLILTKKTFHLIKFLLATFIFFPFFSICTCIFLTSYFREWNLRPRGMETPLRNHQEKMYELEIFQIPVIRFLMVYRTIIDVILHLFIICNDLWCQLPFFHKFSVITEALFSVQCLRCVVVARM